MIKHFDKKFWAEQITNPDWYLKLADEFQRIETVKHELNDVLPALRFAYTGYPYAPLLMKTRS